jgi:hypothetical protein
MKKIAAFIVLFLFAMLAWNLFVHDPGMAFDIDGDAIDGPLGALLFAGGGTLIAGLVMVVVVVGALLALLFAGVGIILFGALGVAALALAAAISPLLLALLPLALVWYLVQRSRRQRALRDQPV